MVKFYGTTYSVRFGTFPMVMEEQKFVRYKHAFKIYGAVTHYIFYAKRSVVVGFALEGKPPQSTDAPRQDQPHALIDKGTYMGNLHPIHDIKPMGIHFCTS